MSELSQINELVQKGRAKQISDAVTTALENGNSPEDILASLMDGMAVIGEKFKNNTVYVPDVLIAARAMSRGIETLKPLFGEAGVKTVGKACIGTVKGDLHDIGKNLVKLMLESKGIEVTDLGVDVPPEKFVGTAKELGCDVICCSALLTTTMGGMRDIVETAEREGIRDSVAILIGGAPITEDFCRSIGADAYTPDAASAADFALNYITKKAEG